MEFRKFLLKDIFLISFSDGEDGGQDALQQERGAGVGRAAVAQVREGGRVIRQGEAGGILQKD